MTKTKDTLFKAEKLSAQTKSEQTTSIAKDILADEASARQKKTDRLRALRLAQEPAPAPKAKKKDRKG
ncbi:MULTISPECIES: hypothetical protein [Rhizobium]|uniref:Uncharacterized protein n=1 Tax=Rhizobium tropici TaxID=398 RepID=A0A6P1C8R0_RHITR|nr:MULTISPECIES: hypothetical protein [Rhizobium]AGB75401.1 hypothetical protein RTCIAT899_PC08070 [Rhizobium tropici CIAT 899]MBB4241779.1 hypothetical protein [Rhizobium tropici]MBB5593574.1 hypothetical protein [Rhizobium tropici]MBB6492104.1 hypothetical protein [Rhizobium tropici]NEV13468.1 hypothetical protein [Rhizobium tropici]